MQEIITPVCLGLQAINVIVDTGYLDEPLAWRHVSPLDCLFSSIQKLSELFMVIWRQGGVRTEPVAADAVRRDSVSEHAPQNVMNNNDNPADSAPAQREHEAMVYILLTSETKILVLNAMALAATVVVMQLHNDPWTKLFALSYLACWLLSKLRTHQPDLASVNWRLRRRVISVIFSCVAHALVWCCMTASRHTVRSASTSSNEPILKNLTNLTYQSLSVATLVGLSLVVSSRDNNNVLSDARIETVGYLLHLNFFCFGAIFAFWNNIFSQGVSSGSLLPGDDFSRDALVWFDVSIICFVTAKCHAHVQAQWPGIVSFLCHFGLAACKYTWQLF